MKHFVLLMTALMALSNPAMAHHTAEHSAGYDTAIVRVNGLVCDFCARALEKVLYQRADVEGVDVDLDTHTVAISTKKGTIIPDEDIKMLVTSAGYTVVEITRTP